MDQNGTPSDKRNWRERLGIGTQDMPKLSEEFKSPGTPPAAARPAAKPPTPVSRPAPMAPRAPAPMAPRVTPPAKSPPPLTNGKSSVSLPAPGAGDALAEKLRAQRAAAERLAEQRVQAARERAENKGAEVTPPMPSTRPRRFDPAAAPPASTSRPKFSFADENAESAALSRLPPVTQTEPRAPLGSDRAQPPFLRPASRLDTPPYRPVEPATGQPGARTQPSFRSSYGAEPPPYVPPSPPSPARRPAYENYARGTEQPFDRGYGDEPPRLTRPPASRSRARTYDDAAEDVFEEEALPPPRRRASARDYQSAYEEHEAPYADERQRSSGPLLILLALVLVGAAAFGAVWYYMNYMKAPVTAGTQTEQVPVVPSPDQPAKTAPETTPDASTAAPAAQRKQIYDRIVGDQEVEGNQVVPTEEVPVQPEPTAPPAEATGEQGAGENGAVAVPDPAAPAPDAGQEPEPLPLPPPPGNDQQGSLDQSGASNLAAAVTEPVATSPPEDTIAGAAKNLQASPPSPEVPAVPVKKPAVEKPKPVAAKKPAASKTKTAAAAKPATAKKKPAATTSEETAAEPVVLVAPSQGASAEPEVATVAEPAPEPAQPAKKKTLLDLFRKGTGDQPAAAQQQVATAEPEPAPAPSKPKSAEAAQEAAPASANGYSIQLASYRTQSEAQTEYQRLRSSHPDVLGDVPSRISQATVAGSTRYRVGVGPLKSREQAAKICNSLFAAGERDCLIRAPQ